MNDHVLMVWAAVGAVIVVFAILCAGAFANIDDLPEEEESAE